MTTTLEANSDTESLRAQIDALTMERDRLVDFRDEVFSLALSAQPGNSAHVCNSILNLAIDQKRENIGKQKDGADGDSRGR